MTSLSANIFDVAIAGAGPAGTSAAIHLALAGARVLLVEEKKFPRQKLCGEFISPECMGHFKRLGVFDQMIFAGGASVSETVFYSRRGNSVAVPSEWFKPGTQALGLSRSEMDHQLLERAKRAGVEVLEAAHASRLLYADEKVHGIRVKKGEATRDCEALITIDATGRTRSLARQLDPQRANRRRHINPLVAFKVHLENTRLTAGACEIYFYKGGYGGLSTVEGGISNLCFIVAADDVRCHGSNPDVVMREVVMKNSRATYTLAEATTRTPWLSVSLETFGRRRLAPAPGLLTIGDAAAFIDPFTGSGMLMALESGEIAAGVIAGNLSALSTSVGLASLADDYRAEYRRNFDSRLRVSGLLRRAAFVPYLDEAAILLFGTSAHLRRRLARATRHSGSAEARPSGV
ncbi:MAG TPA: NAD(P)/FAD-dependent oxidoreductase [Pyrinomonadaceae bacterium]|nr:NAD(P)/FAD-dependent oxidoreductase [Pyrinomonadaceae bacterium]